MTPLANRIVRELTLPTKRREFRDEGDILRHMGDIHCFDVSDVTPLAYQLIDAGFDWGEDKMYEAGRSTSFLPAPKTWIEWTEDEGRFGALLIQSEKEQAGVQFVIGGTVAGRCEKAVFCSVPGVATLALGDALPRTQNRLIVSKSMLAVLNFELVGGLMVRLHAYLALINSPRIVGRKEHQSNSMLAKRLEREKCLIGEYKLNGWSEIKLHVTDPEATGEGIEHMTGEKALHFCRSHLRVRLGRLERVKAHWRGNPEIGVRQGRYTVVP